MVAAHGLTPPRLAIAASIGDKLRTARLHPAIRLSLFAGTGAGALAHFFLGNTSACSITVKRRPGLAYSPDRVFVKQACCASRAIGPHNYQVQNLTDAENENDRPTL